MELGDYEHLLSSTILEVDEAMCNGIFVYAMKTIKILDRAISLKKNSLAAVIAYNMMNREYVCMTDLMMVLYRYPTISLKYLALCGEDYGMERIPKDDIDDLCTMRNALNESWEKYCPTLLVKYSRSYLVSTIIATTNKGIAGWHTHKLCDDYVYDMNRFHKIDVLEKMYDGEYIVHVSHFTPSMFDEVPETESDGSDCSLMISAKKFIAIVGHNYYNEKVLQYPEVNLLPGANKVKLLQHIIIFHASYMCIVDIVRIWMEPIDKLIAETFHKSNCVCNKTTKKKSHHILENLITVIHDIQIKKHARLSYLQEVYVADWMRSDRIIYNYLVAHPDYDRHLLLFFFDCLGQV